MNRNINPVEIAPIEVWNRSNIVQVLHLYHFAVNLRSRAPCVPRIMPRNKENCFDVYNSMQHRQFFQNFRMSRASFDKLYHSESANKANGGHIRAWCRLALAIRYLAGAKLVDICSMFGIAPGTIYQYHKNSVLWSRPKESETDYILQYRNRKTRWAIVALAGCDAKCRFIV